MKNRSKLISKILLLQMILLIFASSCGTQKPDGGTTTAADSTEDTTVAATDTAELEPDLPDVDMGGKIFTFLVKGVGHAEWQSQDIYSAEENGEPINDAVYKRNQFLEEKYNLVIKEYGTTDIAGDAKKSITSGSNDYDVLMANTTDTASLAAQGFLYDLNTLPYLNLDAEWWDQRAVNQLTIGHKLYFCTGDLSIMANDATWIMMYNKQIAEKYGIDDLYSLIKEGKWTFEQMYEYMSLVSTDLNGDSIISPLDDIVGFATHDSSKEGFFFASGSRTVAKDKDDLPYLAMNTERMADIVELVDKLMADPNLTFNLNNNKFGLSKPLEQLQPVFQDNHALFYGEVMQCVIRLRAMEVDFGVIPFPKFDEAQAEYNHYIHTTAAMMSVPKTNPDLDNTAIMLEAMAAKSKYTLRVAYYETCLDEKFVRDDESKDMLDIILETRNYDIGYIYNWGSIYSAFSGSVGRGKPDFASAYATKESSAITAMAKTVDQWMNQ